MGNIILLASYNHLRSELACYDLIVVCGGYEEARSEGHERGGVSVRGEVKEVVL